MNKNEKFVITINRELGSGGRTVGRILAEKLGVPYYDKALTKPLEEKFDMSIDQIEQPKSWVCHITTRPLLNLWKRSLICQ